MSQPIPALLQQVFNLYAKSETDVVLTNQQLESFKTAYDAVGPYSVAKAFGALVDNSGEELAMQWMTYWNAVGWYGRY